MEARHELQLAKSKAKAAAETRTRFQIKQAKLVPEEKLLAFARREIFDRCWFL